MTARSSSRRSLRRAEAVQRAATLAVHGYRVRLDLTGEDGGFGSLTTIRFTSTGEDTFVDLQPRRVHTIRLNGASVPAERVVGGRLPLSPQPGENEVVVDAEMAYRNDGEGLHRTVDPADGLAYVYAMSFMDAAPSFFACFDQPDLKAPLSLEVLAPEAWTVVGNAPGRCVGPGRWALETTPPVSTYVVSLVAGPWHLLRETHDGIGLGLSARRSIARHLDADAEELFTLTRQCFDELHRLFGTRYPFGDYHQAFVPEFNAGAMENPGCVTFRDPLVFTSRVTRGERITRATTIAHEMAHMWFGNLVTPRWWDDLWLNESFAEYLGTRITADATQFTDAWLHNAYARRQWGLVADQRPSTHPVAGTGAEDAASALQDFDGISYHKGASVLKLLNAQVGDEVFLQGVRDHLARHRFGNATMHDLFRSWERAGAGDLSGFVTGWLRSAGADTLLLDRDAGRLVRTGPAGAPSRRHAFRVARAAEPAAGPAPGWAVDRVELVAEATPYPVPDGVPVVLDPFEDTWALTPLDRVSLDALQRLLPGTEDAPLRAGVWNNLRTGFHHGEVAPEDALRLVEATLPTEPRDDAFTSVMTWALDAVVAVSQDPETTLGRLHPVARRRCRTAAHGSLLALAGFQAMVATSQDLGQLDRWGRGSDLPDSLVLDEDLTWRILVRRAVLGGTDRAELAASLDRRPTAVAQVAHTRAVASLPDAGAKAWAWAHFTGEIRAANYDIEAAGAGLWRVGQERLTDEYVGRYFAELPATAGVREGWMLAEAAGAFFPLTSLLQRTQALAADLLADPSLSPPLRRAVVDRADELERRIRVRERYAAPVGAGT